MGKARDISKILTTVENTYLTVSSASSTYATSESLSAIDVDNLPDDLMTMGG
jgi:hypothetical protein